MPCLYGWSFLSSFRLALHYYWLLSVCSVKWCIDRLRLLAWQHRQKVDLNKVLWIRQFYQHFLHTPPSKPFCWKLHVCLTLSCSRLAKKLCVQDSFESFSCCLAAAEVTTSLQSNRQLPSHPRRLQGCCRVFPTSAVSLSKPSGRPSQSGAGTF